MPITQSVDGRRKYVCNEKYFDQIDSQSKAYWLGFIAADGCIVGNSLQINVQAADREHLAKLLFAIESTDSVRDGITKAFGKEYPHARIGVRSRHLVQSLGRHGIQARKSTVQQWPSSVDISLLPHFLRGYVDGDGGFYWYADKKHPQRSGQFIFSFVATEAFCLSARRYLNQIPGVFGGYVRPRGSGNVFTLEYNGSPRVSRIYHHLYDEAAVYLTRKRDRAAEHLEYTTAPLLGLKAARLAANIGQRTLATNADITRATLRSIESGRPALVSTASKLAEALSVNVQVLYDYLPAQGIASNPTHILDLDAAREIRHIHMTTRITQCELGERFGVNRATVSDILRNKKWREAL